MRLIDSTLISRKPHVFYRRCRHALPNSLLTCGKSVVRQLATASFGLAHVELYVLMLLLYIWWNTWVICCVPRMLVV
jgi:hypothetical protein